MFGLMPLLAAASAALSVPCQGRGGCGTGEARIVHATSRRAAVAGLVLSSFAASWPASAKYGEFAKMDGSQNGAAGNDANECLFAQPATGICTVFKSSEPALYKSPDKAKALDKIVAATRSLDGIGEQIESAKWSSVSQSLGASMDLQEAVNFLAAGSDKDLKLAKKVFTDLQGVAVAVKQKNQDASRLYFGKYASDMPALLQQLEVSAAAK